MGGPLEVGKIPQTDSAAKGVDRNEFSSAEIGIPKAKRAQPRDKIQPPSLDPIFHIRGQYEEIRAGHKAYQAC